MPHIRPFRAFTYARTGPDITTLTAPPYDVIAADERAALLARNEHNVVALELAEGPLDPDVPEGRYATAARRWHDWQQDGVVVRDEKPAFYLLEQRFELGGKPVRRRAVIAEVKLHPFEDGVILPHERTLPKALDDRMNLLRATHANFSQVFGLVSDPAGALGAAFEFMAAEEPVMTATDDAGVVSVVWALADPTHVAAIAGAIAGERIFIADGHHRYTVALTYRDEQRAADLAAGRSPVDPDYDFLMMALADMDDPDLVVLPTHRVADAVGTFDADAFYTALSRHFDVTELAPGHPVNALDTVTTPAFLVRTRADLRPHLAKVREEVDLDTAIPLPRSSGWKHLDVAVLQELVLDPLLGIHPDRPETLDRLMFVKDAHAALRSVDEHDVAFVLRPTKMDQMRSVALAGDVMPQKSTYFYPKLLSGLIFRAMEPPTE